MWSGVFKTVPDSRQMLGEDAYLIFALGGLKQASKVQTSLGYIIQALSQKQGRGTKQKTNFLPRLGLAIGRMSGAVEGIHLAGCPGVRSTSML